MVRRRDRHDVDLLVRQHVSQVAVLLRLVSLHLLGVRRRCRGDGLVDVDHGRDLHAGILSDDSNVGRASPSNADDGASSRSLAPTMRECCAAVRVATVVPAVERNFRLSMELLQRFESSRPQSACLVPSYRMQDEAVQDRLGPNRTRRVR